MVYGKRMTETQWNSFCTFRDSFRKKVEEWSAFSQTLMPLQKAAAQDKTPPYPIETPIVYNRALDEITQDDDIKLIVIGDNPGKDEQLLKNNKYLVGQAGKIAAGFFARNPEFSVDFRKNAIILNKTPVHSAKTAQLKYIQKNGGEEIRMLIEESQIWMAEKTAALLKSLETTELWLVGYSELKEKGLFTLYKNALEAACRNDRAWNRIFVFQHFSMNRFSIDLAGFQKNHADFSLQQAVHALGTLHKAEIFTQN